MSVIGLKHTDSVEKSHILNTLLHTESQSCSRKSKTKVFSNDTTVIDLIFHDDAVNINSAGSFTIKIPTRVIFF